MDFALSANQESIRDAVAKICSRFDEAYWLKKDKEGGYPAEFHRALADAGWLGICVPEKLIEAVYLDQRFTTGNVVVWHHAAQALEVLPTNRA